MFWTGLPPSALILSEFFYENKNSYLLTEKRGNDFSFNSLIDNLLYLNEISIKHILELLNKTDIIFVSGWSSFFSKFLLCYSIFFNKKIVLMLDNYRKTGVRQIFGRFIFRLTLQFVIDKYFVPGLASQQFLNYYGVKDQDIFMGYYGASEKVFYKYVDYESRDLAFVFVGQLIDRKSIIELIEAYNLYLELGGDWKLIIVGDGPLRHNIEINSILDYRGFLSPEELRVVYNNSSAFCLFSKVEHWGTVVCEAAMCGLPLLLSNSVGSSVDLVLENGLIVDKIDFNSIANLMLEFSSLHSDSRKKMSDNSLLVSSNYNSQTTKNKILKILNSFNEQN